MGKVLYGWINKVTWKSHAWTPWCWYAQGWNESVTAGEDGWGVRQGTPRGSGSGDSRKSQARDLT